MDLAAALLEKEQENERLKAELAELRSQSAARIDALLSTIKGKDQEIEKLRHRLDQLCRHVFGRRAEHLDPNQLKLAFAMLQAEQTEPAQATAPVDQVAAPRRGGHGRRRVPEDLVRADPIVIHPLPEDRICGVCGKAMTPIAGPGAVTELVEFKPSCMYVQPYHRVKYACREHEEAGVACGELPPMPIVKGMPGPGLLAHIATSRFSDHLPYDRLERIFERYGFPLSKSTMCGWMGELEFAFHPIYVAILKQILASLVIQTDDTIVCIQDPSVEGGSKKGHFWAYRGERGSVAYDYTPTRSGEGPAKVLAGFKGYLQADAFSGYDRLYESGDVLEVACLAHVRRKFWEAKDTEPKALEALSKIGELYAIEREATERGLDHAARGELRREKAPRHLANFKEWLDATAEFARPTSPLGTAVTYARNLGDALGRYVEDGRIPIDNNLVELCMRHVAVGRKNWLHAQGDEGGRRNAVLFSLVMSCRELGHDPYAYFHDVIQRISAHPASRIAELTPRFWKPPPSSVAAPS